MGFSTHVECVGLLTRVERWYNKVWAAMDNSVVALFWCKKDNLRANNRVDRNAFKLWVAGFTP